MTQPRQSDNSIVRRAKKEIKFQDHWLEKIITAFCLNVRELRQSKGLTQQ